MPVSRWSFVFLALAAAIACGILYSQQATPPADEIIRVTVDLVQVDAVVTDSTGRHVPGLTANDFELSIGGKPTPITNFDFVNSGPTTKPTSVKPHREDVRRSLVFVIDNLYTEQKEIAQLIPVARRFVEEQVQPGDLVSVMSTNSGMGIYEEFTSDKRKLRSALDQLTRRMTRSSELRDFGLYLKMGEYYHGAALNTIERAVYGMREMPGRKSILYFAPDFELSVGGTFYLDSMLSRVMRLIDIANRSGVTFYTFNTRGVEATVSKGLSKMMAEETGGVYSSTNRISKDIDKAMADMTGYYLLGYRPDPKDTKAKPGAIDRRSAKIKVKREGLSVRSRKGIGIEVVTPVEPKTRLEFLSKAMFSPFDSGGIAVRLTPVYTGSPVDPKTRKRQAMLRAVLAIDPTGFVIAEGEAGRKKVAFDVATVAFDGNGKQAGVADKTYTVDLTSAGAEQFSRQTLIYQIDVPVLKPGPYQLRTAIRDVTSGKTGSAASFVELPDFNSSRLSISSLLLSAGAKGNPESLSRREFSAGSKVYYLSELYGARTDKASSTAKLDVTMHLYRNGQKILSSKSTPFTPNDSDQVVVTGDFQLPAGLTPGEYEMELAIKDNLADGKRQDVSTWTDFILK
jgi:VWFA-related protein